MPASIVVYRSSRKRRDPHKLLPRTRTPAPSPEQDAAADARVRRWLEHQLAYARGDVPSWKMNCD
jgi:hypothetical protein